MNLEYFTKEAEDILEALYGIKLNDITDEKEIELHFHQGDTPYGFICYLADKYSLVSKH